MKIGYEDQRSGTGLPKYPKIEQMTLKKQLEYFALHISAICN